LSVRIIARLDIKGPNLVKGIHLEGLRVVGKPERQARRYYEAGADELIYMDVVASLYGRNSLLDFVERTARDVFVPLTVGGGLRTVDDIRSVLRAGADKVAVNTAAIARPEFITEAARVFGASTIVVSIAAIRQANGTYLAYTDGGREHTGVEVIGWAERAEQLGAGEILITSVDREGTGKGLDLELTRAVSRRVSIPVIAAGGAGTCEHVREAAVCGEADAVALASLLHYNHMAEFEESEPGCLPGEATTGDDLHCEGNTEFLRRRRVGFSNIESTSLPRLKQYLIERGVACRPAVDAGAA
jgi:cyclase